MGDPLSLLKIQNIPIFINSLTSLLRFRLGRGISLFERELEPRGGSFGIGLLTVLMYGVVVVDDRV